MDDGDRAAKERAKERAREALATGCIVAGLAAFVVGVAVWQAAGGDAAALGAVATFIAIYAIARAIMREEPGAAGPPIRRVDRIEPPPPPAPPPARDSRGDRLEIVDDPLAQVLTHAVEVSSAPASVIVVVSTSAEKLAKVKERLVAGGVVRARIADATAESFARRDEIEHAEVSCILLDPGTWGPAYALPLGAYTGQVRVVVLDPQTLTTTAMERVKRCVGEGPRSPAPAPVAAAPPPPAPATDEVRGLVEELVRIGRKSPDGRSSSCFLGTARGRAREIGEKLDGLGGLDLMLAAHAEVARALRGASGRELEAAWDGIGEWQG